MTTQFIINAKYEFFQYKRFFKILLKRKIAHAYVAKIFYKVRLF